MPTPAQGRAAEMVQLHHDRADRTARVDTGRGADLDSIGIARLSAALGRDPAIEDAKRLLCERHGLTGAEAFELLRRVSQHRNRKLRDVARDVLSSAS